MVASSGVVNEKKMKKHTLRAIIVLMTLAMLGLISFQLYWINNAIKVHQAQFKQDVHEALQSVADKLEKQEIIYLAANHLKIATNNNHRDCQDPCEANQQENRLDSIIKIYDVYNKKNTSPYSYQTKYESYSYQKSAQLLNGVSQNIQFEFSTGSYDTTISLAFDKDFNSHKLIDKTSIVSVVLEELIATNSGARKAINYQLVDSLLKIELSNRGIDLQPDLGVYNKKQSQFTYLNAGIADQQKMLNSGMMVNLFPNDLLGSFNYLVVNFPNQQRWLIKKIWFTLTSSAVLVIVIMFIFGFAIFTILKQKKLSEIKNDFINNMTHEFKTPISTVSLACEALQEPEAKHAPSFIDRYVGIIADENKRLGQQVEKVLQIATLDKKDFKFKPENLDLHQIITQAVGNIALAVEKKQGAIEMQLEATNPILFSDKLHLTNIVNNLLDNANKYSPHKPRIVIKTSKTDNGIILQVMDNGVGISREEAQRIFDKFYRVPTGNLHDVKGFGLGLTYVKTIVDAMGGSISVASTPRKGSTFTISIPSKHEF